MTGARRHFQPVQGIVGPRQTLVSAGQQVALGGQAPDHRQLGLTGQQIYGVRAQRLRGQRTANGGRDGPACQPDHDGRAGGQ